MMHDSMSAAMTASQLDVVARELAIVNERILDAASRARSLAAATDWRARAAEAFHARAEEWAREISSLVCLAETARLAAAQARDAAYLRHDGGF
ncbi:hypothetical protein [Microbacterium sulfonylureivorans]|uniref:hypothetical protein n=1 Tax=Microbacterium sulfonylureivorans TaxID=2486854 RepID=UPI001F0C2624|nr:hypothetical protein [Microbacterium sulfonylureivorans]